MSYLVLARKWRPKTFSEVVGQTTVTRTLQNALSSGRIGHAFLLSGARGVGKTTTARILAKALNCSKGEAPTPEPCGECSSCLEIAAGSALDVQEIDGATHNGVEQVRELRESARYNPARDRFKIWIIDEVHMLSAGAFNALLKTLEEPPPRVKFIFATTEYHKLPDTILSRCQHYDFRLIPAREIAEHLRSVADGEGIQVSAEALGRIARAAEGSARDALSLFDQVLSFSGSRVRDEDLAALLGLIDRELLFAASDGLVSADGRGLLELVDRLSEHGADYRNFTRELLLHFREILLVKLFPPGSSLLDHVVPDERPRLQAVANAFSEEDLLRTLDVLTKAEGDLRWSQDPRVTLELALLKLVQMRHLVPFSELVERVERLASAAPAPRPAPARGAERPPVPPPSKTPAPETESLLSRLLGQFESRPSLAQPLRSAQERLEGDVLTLAVLPDFVALARMHTEEYSRAASKASGRTIRVEIAQGATPEEPAAAASEGKRERLMKEATREPAVQEALDLFGGKVVDVRETSSVKEGA